MSDGDTSAQAQAKSATQDVLDLTTMMFRPHPWHGLTAGDVAPDTVTAYIECCPGEGVKYEVNKKTGYLMVDRPHKFSSLCPTLYGFIPSTYCGDRVAKACMDAVGEKGIKGDADPLDICVLSTRAISHGDLTLTCRPVGGLRMIDDGEADDKIIAVIVGDSTMGDWNDIGDLPPPLLAMVEHYFLTYKVGPQESKLSMEQRSVRIPQVYGREEALRVIRDSMQDYEEKFSAMKEVFFEAIVEAMAKRMLPSNTTVTVQTGESEEEPPKKKRK